MASPSREERYDYTEGASAIDIEEAIHNSRGIRRDSRYGEDGEGSMFAGPGHEGHPSSISRMSLSEHGRRSSEDWGHRSLSRRRSEDSSRGAVRPSSRSSRRSIDSYISSASARPIPDEYASETEEEDHDIPRRLKSKSPSPTRAHAGTVFDNIAHMFGRTPQIAESPPRSRRASLSSRSSRTGLLRRHSSRRSDAGSDYAIESEVSDDERWGYASEEEDEDYESDTHEREFDSDSMDLRSFDERSFPPPPGATLPLMGGDPLFGGEERIDICELEPLAPPPPGLPSRQMLYILDEDAHVRFVGYETIQWRQFLWRLCTIISFGILGLLGHWFPRIWLRWVAHEKAFKDIKQGFIVVESAYRDIALFPISDIEYHYHVSTVFPFESESNQANGNANGDSGVLDHLRIVDYRYARFVLNPRTGLFQMLKDWRDPSWNNIRSVQNGLDNTIQTQRRILFGDNIIDIQGKSSIALLIEEIIHPFYVFQIASIILWSLDDYYYYAFCIFLISAISITTTLVETKKTIKRMREMSRFSCPVNVFSEGRWNERDSSTLVPGDMINLSNPPLTLFPADLFLLAGDAIVNESMLTGESIPVSKIPVKDEDLNRWKDVKDITGDMAKSFLYAGTRVVRIRNGLNVDGTPGRPAVGLVVRTSFNTTKGALVRSMLFPKPMGFQFYRDSIRFILVLAGIAGLGFFASAFQFIRLGVQWHTIILRALDLITVVVPPALPATLSIGTSFAIGRLRKLGIFCVSPSRVNVGGRINVCCFDKTGTLTEDGLDILGVRSLERHVHRFGELIEDVRDMPTNHGKANFLYALATCHSLKKVDGKIIGDPLDVKMFEFTKWALEEGEIGGTAVVKSKAGDRPAALVQTIVRPPGSAKFKVEDALKGAGRHAHFLELGVIRTFEFVSALRRMSVIVKRLKSNSMEVYVKGAPEVMVDICKKNSFPNDYDDLLSYYTKRGYRVIAIAGKSIEGLSWLKAQKMKREQAESGLQFLGLVIFENKLKAGTIPAIQELRRAHLPCRMITGDNPLTAVSVARECGVINTAAQVFAPTFIIGNALTPRAKLEWTCMDEDRWKLDEYTLKPLQPPLHSTIDDGALDHHDYTLVVPGDVFRWMLNNAALETLQRMLVRAQIYARMSPDEKNEVVERLQGLGYTVLMCGDGANDCSALKAADVGISLSEAEASVAAPFTSQIPDISCVLEVIREGRAALVTSFSCFKYMALYSLIQFTTITLLYSFASSLGDFQFLYIDLFIIIPIAVTMGRTKPYPNIHPKGPTASLVSKKVLSSIIGQIVINAVVQFWAFFWVKLQPWYTPPLQNRPTSSSDKLQAQNYENSVLFLVSCFQYILVAAVFSIGPPYRKPMWTNLLLMLSITCLTLFNFLVLLAPPDFVVSILELMPLPFSARLTLLIAVVVNVAVSVAYEHWGAKTVSQLIGSAMRMQHQMRTRHGKTYKAVDSVMR